MSRESQNRNQTRSRILDAAEQLLEQNSAQSFKVSDIAGEAGVSPSLVIQYFNSKDDLVFETCIRRMLRMYPDTFAGAPRDLPKLFMFLFERDLQFAHIVRDLLSLSWRWSEDAERRLEEAAAPRTEALRTALAHRLRDLPAGDLERTVALCNDLYIAALRRACVSRLSAEEAFARFEPALEQALAGIRPR